MTWLNSHLDENERGVYANALESLSEKKGVFFKIVTKEKEFQKMLLSLSKDEVFVTYITIIIEREFSGIPWSLNTPPEQGLLLLFPFYIFFYLQKKKKKKKKKRNHAKEKDLKFVRLIMGDLNEFHLNVLANPIKK
jgi:hypothetical protein